MDAEVLFDYKKTEEDELDLEVGKILHNVKTVDEGWCEGELNGVRGMFPDNFVKLIEVPIRESGGATKIRRAKVAFSYVAENTDELSLQPGQEVMVVDEVEDGWFKGRLNGKEGVFPSNFIDPTTLTDYDSAASEPARVEEPPVVAALSKPRNVMGGHKLFPSLDPTKVRAGLKPVGDKKPAAPPPATPAPPVSKAAPPPAVTKAPAPPVTKAAPPPPAKEEFSLEKAKALFAYAAENADELSMKQGDIVDIIDKHVGQEGWWKASLGDQVGLIPDNFVELIPHNEHKAVPTIKPKESKPPPKEAPLKPTGPRSTSVSRPPPPPAAEPKATPINKEEHLEINDNPDFGVPHTDPLDNSAVKDRPKKASRPPSRTNLRMDEVNNLDDPKPAPTGTAGGAGGTAGGALTPWQAEMKKRKKPPPPAPGGKPSAATKKPVIKPHPAPAKPPPTSTIKPKPPLVEVNSQPPSDTPFSHNPPTPTPSQTTTPVHAPPPDDSWKEAYDNLKAEFNQFKASVKEQLGIFTDDLDNERKCIRGLEVDIDRLKKQSSLLK